MGGSYPFQTSPLVVPYPSSRGAERRDDDENVREGETEDKYD